MCFENTGFEGLADKIGSRLRKGLGKDDDEHVADKIVNFTEKIISTISRSNSPLKHKIESRVRSNIAEMCLLTLDNPILSTDFLFSFKYIILS